MTFKCLNGLTATGAHISDHEPVVHGDVLSWNIWAPGSPGMVPKITEDIKKDEQNIRARLSKIAAVIAEIVNNPKQSPPIHVICLQEIPRPGGTPDYYKIFVEELTKNHVPNRLLGRLGLSNPTTITQNAKFNQLSLFDEQYSCNDITQEVSKSLSAEHQGRVQAYGLMNAQGQYREIANIHFPSYAHSDPKNQIKLKDLHSLLQQGITVAGDYNDDILWMNNPSIQNTQMHKDIRALQATHIAGSRTYAGSAKTVDLIVTSQNTKNLDYRKRNITPIIPLALNVSTPNTSTTEQKRRSDVTAPSLPVSTTPLPMAPFKPKERLTHLENDQARLSAHFSTPNTATAANAFSAQKPSPNPSPPQNQNPPSFSPAYEQSTQKTDAKTTVAEIDNLSDRLWKKITGIDNPEFNIQQELQPYLDIVPKDLTAGFNVVDKLNKNTFTIGDSVGDKLSINREKDKISLVAMTLKGDGISAAVLLVANAKRIAQCKLDERISPIDPTGLSAEQLKKKQEEAKTQVMTDNPALLHFSIAKCANAKDIAIIIAEMNKGSPKLTATLTKAAKNQVLYALSTEDPKNSLTAGERELLKKQLEAQDQRAATATEAIKSKPSIK